MACRYFVAVKPSKNTRINISEILPNVLTENDLNKLRLVFIENLHLTLLFLGHKSDYQLNMDKKVIERISKDVSPFELQLNKIEPFPGTRYSRGIWISGKPNDMFAKLNDMLSLHVEFPNSKIFSNQVLPHCTIARFKHHVNMPERIRISKQIAANPIRVSLKIRVNSISLFKTCITKNVLFYELLEEYLLSKCPS